MPDKVIVDIDQQEPKKEFKSITTHNINGTIKFQEVKDDGIVIEAHHNQTSLIFSVYYTKEEFKKIFSIITS